MKRSLFVAVFAFLALSPAAARAEDKIIAAPTLFVSLSLGDKLAIGLGVDVRMTVLGAGDIGACNSKNRWGGGPFLQATWLIPGAWRFAGGGHFGGEVAESVYAADGELGWTYRTSIDDRPGGHGVHVGVMNAIFPVQTLAMRTTFSSFGGHLVPEGTIAIGGGFPQAFGLPGSCIID